MLTRISCDRMPLTTGTVEELAFVAQAVLFLGFFLNCPSSERDFQRYSPDRIDSWIKNMEMLQRSKMLSWSKSSIPPRGVAIWDMESEEDGV